MRALLAFALLVSGTAASAQEYVHGYTTKNGTYVAPYYRSSPNSTTLDNYSTKGNVNPYTGAEGTRNPQPSYSYKPYVNPYSSPYPTPYVNPYANPYATPDTSGSSDGSDPQ